MPALQENEYLLVFSPNEELHRRIMQVKQHFAENFNCEPAKKALPHITVISFVQLQMNESMLIRRMQNRVEAHAPFTIDLNGFGSFPSHTIYINVQAKQKITGLVKSLRALQKWMKTDNEHKPHFITEPHLTIARRLEPWQYEKAWLEYEHANFTGMFTASELLLLKRKQGERYRPAAVFQLKGKHSNSFVQPSLFA
jgi:2'-5' RNA ligase